MKSLLCSLIVWMSFGASADEAVKKAAIWKDSEAIQGTWKAVALEANGNAAPAAIVASLKLVFKDNTVTFTPGEPGFTNYTFKLDPDAKPAVFAMTHADGSQKGKTSNGIYLLNGDQLKLCFAPGDETPGELTAESGSGQAVYTLERVK